MLKYHIQTVELTSAQADISFNSIPQDFTDIYFSISGRTNQADNIGYSTFYVNNSTSNWSVRYLQGNSSAVASASTTSIPDFFMSGGNTTSNTFGNGTIYIPNYTAAVNKSMSIDFVNENNATGAFSAMQRIVAALWSNTAPITSAQFVANSGSNFVAGTSISLYGVRRGDSKETASATGGTVTTSGGYTIHTFNTSGTFMVNRDLEAEYLVIAGGGGGAYGGGGAGGYRSSVTSENSGGGATAESKVSLISGTPYTVTVGAGGSAGQNTGTSATNGVNSSFSSVTSIGGARGGQFSNSGGGANNGFVGGSGSGAGGSDTGVPGGTGGAGTANQGFAGGNGTSLSTTNAGGGGGGAGAIGGNGTSNSNGGQGGTGVASSITGASATRAGGGSGGGSTATAGGTGGGGAGAASSQTGGTATANTGGGGGGGGNTIQTLGGPGGSGVVIIRYLTP